MTSFYYEDGNDNVYNEQGEKVLDPIEGILTEITDPNIILEGITSQQFYLAIKPPEKVIEKNLHKEPKPAKPATKKYNKYSDRERERFIDRMIEVPEERCNIARFARELAIDTGEVPYKHVASGPISSITAEHQNHIYSLLDQDAQLYAEDIIEDLTKQFDGFSISKSHMNSYLKNVMLVTVKNSTFEPEKKNSVGNLNIRFEWFTKWKNTDLDFTKNSMFIDEAGFHISMRNN